MRIRTIEGVFFFLSFFLLLLCPSGFQQDRKLILTSCQNKFHSLSAVSVFQSWKAINTDLTIRISRILFKKYSSVFVVLLMSDFFFYEKIIYLFNL